MPYAARIAVADATPAYDHEYTYRVPSPMEGHVFAGSLVLVPFGRGKSRPRMGVVLGVEKAGELGANIKDILDAAPESAQLNDELLAIVGYLREATFCTWFEAVRTVLPQGAQYKPAFTPGEGWRLKASLSRHTQSIFRLAPGWQEKLQTASRVSEKQQLALKALEGGPLPKAELLAASGAGPGVLETLLKKGLVEKHEEDKRLVLSGCGQEGEGPQLVLSPAQKEVARGLVADMEAEKPRPALLQGVTGSGKTPVFLELIRHALSKGKTALVLVPEIGLTPQMVERLCESFGDKVAVQHSALSHTERLLQWRQIKRGETPVVVGTRSAVFAPLENIGVIIIDEEQEHTYKSENAPRYSAIDVAKGRAARHRALLLLASATPAVEDYHLAKQGRYSLYHLHERYGHMPLPRVEMVDLRTEAPLLSGTAAISQTLAGELAANLERGQQSILLLNRRGYHRAAICRSCGKAVKCGECSVPMVYHRQGPRLLCHYCGKSLAPPEKCPECGGEIRYMGFGTQLIEEELATLFPTAGILRMDMDSTGQKGAHAEMLRSFGRGEYDILLGTQMVAKGLDFERVTLVGVIGIDSLLFSQGYRAYENVFSLVTQVVGRAGRAGAGGQGRALIQTVDPENPVLNLAARQNYEAFYAQEIGFRKMALYPPFCSICTVGFSSENEADAYGCAARFSAILGRLAARGEKLPLRILGPAPMSVVQVAGAYRYRLTLKCRADRAFRALARAALEEYNGEGLARKASLWLDFYSQ